MVHHICGVVLTLCISNNYSYWSRALSSSPSIILRFCIYNNYNNFDNCLSYIPLMWHPLLIQEMLSSLLLSKVSNNEYKFEIPIHENLSIYLYIYLSIYLYNFSISNWTMGYIALVLIWHRNNTIVLDWAKMFPGVKQSRLY